MTRDASAIQISLLFWISIIGAMFLVAFLLRAENNRGSSDLGLCSKHYRYEDFISTFRHASVIRTGWLDNTFNAHGCPNAEKLLLEPRPLDLRVHIINGPGLRNGRLEAHEIHAGSTIKTLSKRIERGDTKFLNKFRTRLRKLKELVDRRPENLTLLISTCLECDFAKPQRRKLLREASRFFPARTLVDNPLSDSCLSGFLCEKHGISGRGDILDLDGDIVSTQDAANWARSHKRNRATYLWKECKNGFLPGESWKPPTKRTHFCTEKNQSSIALLLGDKK